jgi:bifunctional DNA-binding transcriptional regulator/antitoxin component of YhaV-PrlF toxin-antitoxin module
MKVQERKIGKYKQLYITLPFKICEAMNIKKGTELDISVAGKDRLELRKV